VSRSAFRARVRVSRVSRNEGSRSWSPMVGGAVRGEIGGQTRSLVADALSVRGVPVVEILSESSYRMHRRPNMWLRIGRSAAARGVVVHHSRRRIALPRPIIAGEHPEIAGLGSSPPRPCDGPADTR
jgi:hypothetical protein